MSTARRPPRDLRASRRAEVERRFRDLLLALGHPARGELARTPKRAAELWLDHLLAGEHAVVGDILQRRISSRSRAPVVLTRLGVHLVCPHHLTVALGHADVAYAPRGHIVGFGALTRLVEALSSRLALQEDVTRDIAQALVEHLGAGAAVARIEAAHPCHAVAHGRAHEARAITWASAGDEVTARRLERAIAAERDSR